MNEECPDNHMQDHWSAEQTSCEKTVDMAFQSRDFAQHEVLAQSTNSNHVNSEVSQSTEDGICKSEYISPTSIKPVETHGSNVVTGIESNGLISSKEQTCHAVGASTKQTVELTKSIADCSNTNNHFRHISCDSDDTESSKVVHRQCTDASNIDLKNTTDHAEENVCLVEGENPTSYGGKIDATPTEERDTYDDKSPWNSSSEMRKSKFEPICTRIKEKKTYTDVDIDDDEIEGKRNYSIEEKLKSHKFNKRYVKVLKGEEFTLKYIQEHGLETPIVFHEKAGLGLRVPSQNFHVSDVKQCVGSRRMVDVMDVTTQKGMEMSMREWVQYFDNPERERLLNVISLEFSHTKLENYVESPNLVRQIDWVDTVWPPHFKECQTESTNIIEKMKYPKVQKYCLMSVAGCYTDFHIDFGGTSVWYHILHGEKVFWLIPPTEKNVEMYVNWVLSGKQGDAFLADHVEGCQRIELHEGYTFIIPSGWIHAVYTPKDSLVFGGNFVHSFNIINQLRVCEVEDRTHVPQKFRYPFYHETAWYVLARYVACVAGKSYVELPPEDKENDDKSQLSVFDEGSRSPSQYSVESIVMDNKKSNKDGSRPATPKLSKSVTIELTRIDAALKKSNEEDNIPHKRGSPRKSSSDSCSSADTVIYDKPSDFEDSPKQESESVKEEKGGRRKTKTDNESNLIPVSKEKRDIYLTKWEIKGLQRLIDWLDDLPANKKGIPKDMVDADAVLREAKLLIEEHKGDNQTLACTGEQFLVWPPSKKKNKPKSFKHGSGPKPKSQKGSPSSNIRRRRTRCKKCEPCTRTDCGECNFCKDMKKYGGPGRMKQSCISRQCLAPVLPHTALCMICGDDTRVKDENTDEMVSTLMECGICWEIVHPPCLSQKYENLDNEGNVNEDLPNSWECPKCCHDGKQGQLKPRTFKGCSTKKLGDGQLSSSNESLLDAGKPRSPETQGKRVISKQGSTEKEPDNVKEEPVNVEVKDEVMEEEPPKLKENPVQKQTVPKSTSGRASLSPRKHLQSIMNRKKNKSPVKSKSPLNSPMKKKRLSSPAPLPVESATSMSPVASTDPVITRSGRTVKRSPQLTDENVESDIPRKRPKREGTASSPDGTGIHGNKGIVNDGSPALCLRNRVHTQNESQPGPSRSPRIQGFSRKSLKFGRSKSASSIRKSLQSSSRKKTKFMKNSIHGGSPRKLSPEKGMPTEGLTHDSSVSPKKKSGQNRPKQEILKGRKSYPSTENEREVSGPSKSGTLPKEPMVVLERYVVRPGPAQPPPEQFKLRSGANHCLNRELWLKIFSFLNYIDLSRCLAVCKVWNWWAYNPMLWKSIDLNGQRIVQAHLIGIVRRQPRVLNLNSVVMTQHQLLWLSARLPQLKELSLVSCSWATVSALCFSTCPLLYTLDLSWMTDLTEQNFHDLLTPPTDRRPGMKPISRLHRLKTLAVTGTEITDNCIQTMVLHLTHLEVLDIGYCTYITDQGIKHLNDPDSSLKDTLRYLNISGCKRVSDEAIKSLVHCSNLKTVNIGRCPGITEKVVQNFPIKSVNFIR